MITRRAVFPVFLGMTALCTTGQMAAGQPVAVPAPRPVLSITGKISTVATGAAAVFTLPMLEEMDLATIRTTTPWYTGLVTFEGVPLTKLMQAVGATGTQLSVHALNDYASEIPIEDFAKYGPILAIKRDGKYMPVSDKGPLFIVYPYDSTPELKAQKYYSRSPWQVAKIEVI